MDLQDQDLVWRIC